jgi:hypothetical protein
MVHNGKQVLACSPAGAISFGVACPLACSIHGAVVYEDMG